MTFREMTFQDKLDLPPGILPAEADQPFLQDMVRNQSPIIKVWFVIMLLNLAMFLFILH